MITLTSTYGTHLLRKCQYSIIIKPLTQTLTLALIVSKGLQEIHLERLPKDGISKDPIKITEYKTLWKMSSSFSDDH